MYFSVMVTLIATALGLVATPIATLVMISLDIPFTVIQSGDLVWTFSDPVGLLLSLVFAGLGLLLATGTMHLARWTGKVHGKFAKALLVSD